MAQTIIDDPIINSPFREPARHFKFDEDGITNEIVSRRRSSHFVPIARAKKKGTQLQFDTEWTKDRIEHNPGINRVRERVGVWRQGGYVGVTGTTRACSTIGQRRTRPPLFFCQIEALETAIYLTEVARQVRRCLDRERSAHANNTSQPGPAPHGAQDGDRHRQDGRHGACSSPGRRSTSSQIAQDARFSDAFLIVTPGITIRDRLRVLLPTDPDNYYRQRDIVPPDLLDRARARRRILDHQLPRVPPARAWRRGELTKEILAQRRASPFVETPDQMVRRVCRDLGGKKNIVVINDEAHHCYRRKPEPRDGDADRRRAAEAEQRDKEARVWMSGLEAVKGKLGVKASTTCRRRRSSCGARATRKARSSRGWSPTSR